MFNQFKNKKGMLANLIGVFVTILIGISLAGTISQEIDNIISCNSSIFNNTGQENITLPDKNDDYYGKTDSFGGGGAEQHFGGYDGTVKTKSFLSNLAPLKTEDSYIGCEQYEEFRPGTLLGTTLQLVPGFFILAMMLMAIMQISVALRSAGFLSNEL